MQKVLTAEEMREVDRLTTEKYGIPSIILMESAAHAVANVIKEKLCGSVEGKSFLILCGKGNNGGDGAALARILWTQGAHVRVILFGRVSETAGDAKTNFEIVSKLSDSKEVTASADGVHLYFSEIPTEGQWHKEYQGYNNEDAVIDALFGTGLSREIDGNVAPAVQTFRYWKSEHQKPLLVSVDVPSGLNADSGKRLGENFDAHLTVTFTAPKLANILPPASNFNGELRVVNIGSPRELIDNSASKTFLAEREDAQNWLEKTKFADSSYKNKRGHALFLAGSRDYMGAAVLAGNAAMVSGVGLTTVATSNSAQTTVSAKALEEIITHGLPENGDGTISDTAFEKIRQVAEKADVIGIGCGLGKVSRHLIRQLVEHRRTPLIIDADGLNALAPFDLKGNDEFPLILTPHEGEFLRLAGTNDNKFLDDRVKTVRDFAEKHHVILVLKGERTLIGAPDGTVVINPTGNSGLGKAGNGDTLTGIITGFVAQAVQMKVDVFETVVAAVYIGGLAGDIAAENFGKRTMLASDVRHSLKKALATLAAKP